jgi:hypothetical protein
MESDDPTAVTSDILDQIALANTGINLQLEIPPMSFAQYTNFRIIV